MKKEQYDVLSEEEILKYRKEYKKLLAHGDLKQRQEFKHKFFSLENYSENYKSRVWIRIIGR